MLEKKVGNSQCFILAQFDLIQLLMKNGADDNCTCYSGPALCLAAEKGHIEIVEFLLEHGVDVGLIFETPNRIFTALHQAARHGHSDIFQLLLKHGANDNLKNHSNETALHYAAIGDHPKIIKILLENGAAVNSQSRCSATAFDYATDSLKRNGNWFSFLSPFNSAAILKRYGGEWGRMEKNARFVCWNLQDDWE